MAAASIPGLKLGHSADEQSLLKELHAAMADGGIKMSNEDIAAAGTEKSLNPREIAARELSERIYQQGQVVQKLRAADPTPESKKALFEAIQVLKELKATEH